MDINMKSIRQKIEEKGVTARHVAKMVGIHYTTLSKIINGHQPYISAALEDKIHQYLDGLNSDVKIN